jgi:hypothetical protein
MSATDLYVSEIAYDLGFEYPSHSARYSGQNPTFPIWNSGSRSIDHPIFFMPIRKDFGISTL